MTRATDRVLMLGTAIEGRGGIASLLGVLRDDGLFERASVRYLATHAEGTRWRKLCAAAGGSLRMLIALMVDRPAVVHVHAASHGSFARKSLLLLVARVAGCRTVFHLHGGGFRAFATIESGPLKRWWIRHTLHTSSAVIAPSDSWADFLRTYAPRARIVVVPNAVRIDGAPATAGAVAQAAAGEAGRVLFLGRVDAAKGVDDLLAAVALIAADFPQLQLVLGGDGDSASARRHADALGIGERVMLPGWLDDAAKARELARAAIFCLPSHAEGLPMAMLEAMAAAKPVVVTPVGGIPEAVTDGVDALLVPPHDVNALAAALARLLGDAALCARLGANARATIVARYSATVITNRLTQLYRELAARPGASGAPTATRPMRGIARVRWLANRLSCMPLPEIGYRLRRFGWRVVERHSLPVRAERPVLPFARLRACSAPELSPGDVAALLIDARRIGAGQVKVFGARSVALGAAVRWNTDPESGITGPSTYAGAIDVHAHAQVGDIRLVWEINRHLHLVRLAQACAVSGDAQYAQLLRTQLRSWLDQCPPLVGPNWASPLELGVRLISWSLIWRFTGGENGMLFAHAAGPALRDDWLASIHAHCKVIARHLSRHSSANNHLMGELAGLYVGAVTWPCWLESAQGRRQARRELAEQATLQYSADGVHREQAFGYHVFCTELLFVAALAAQQHGDHFARPTWMGLQRALRFVRSVRDAGGALPNVGDSDDACVYRLDPRSDHARAAHLLALGDALCDGASPTDATVRWLLYAFPGQRPRVPQLRPAQSWAFPDGGYLLFGSDFGSAREIKGLFDCGPLGYLGIAAHGHADAFAVTLSVGGAPCLVDAGTYSYRAGAAWRRHFRGTAAHNTLLVDGVDQSEGGGPFLWLRKAATRIERMPHGPGRFGCRAAHDGYQRLLDPVTHARTVVFDERHHCLCVTDTIRANTIHRLEQRWHFAPELAIAIEDNRVVVKGQQYKMLLEAHGANIQLELLYGIENAPEGWYSCTYGKKQACHVLIITTLSDAGPIECRFTITFD